MLYLKFIANLFVSTTYIPFLAAPGAQEVALSVCLSVCDFYEFLTHSQFSLSSLFALSFLIHFLIHFIILNAYFIKLAEHKILRLVVMDSNHSIHG